MVCPRSRALLLEGGITCGGGGSKRAWRRLATGSPRRRARYGCNWRQRADGGRKTGRDDGREVASATIVA
jgi:hypothetical protein